MSFNFPMFFPVLEEMNICGTPDGSEGSISFSMLSSMRSHLVTASSLRLVRSSGL